MNPLRTIPRTLLDGWLKVVKTPADTALGAMGREAGQIAIDRTDASVRAVAGTVLRDD